MAGVHTRAAVYCTTACFAGAISRPTVTDEYSSRGAALKVFGANNASNPNWTPQRVKTLLLRQPAADVSEVVHGEWLRADDDWNSLTTIQCSLCSEEWCFETDDDVSLLNYKYCPNCGAKMDGGNDNVSD